jgi:hypothetical protein
MYREATELEEKLRHISVALEDALLENMSRNPFDTLQKVMSMEQGSVSISVVSATNGLPH